MKIASSSISMDSRHVYESHASERRVVVAMEAGTRESLAASSAAVYDDSGGGPAPEPLGYRPDGEQPFKAPEMPDARQLIARAGHLRRHGPIRLEDRYDLRRSLLEQLLEALTGKPGAKTVRIRDGEALDHRSAPALLDFGALGSADVGTTASGTLWRRMTTASFGERSESEYTTFQSRGLAVTEDGRAIDFDVEFSMARSFTEKYKSLTSASYLLTDPLVINLDSNITSVSDVKFKFDLDTDGVEEEISFAGAGSGFLALDRDGNGRIDDGSELFGTASGDGFADLAAYDEDGNGWIDENDAVYSRLRVWTRDADGADRLLSLKEADVGAIYLGSVSTEFSLNDASTNETNAVLRRSGVYLKESGGAGTLSHVDLRC